MGDIRRAHALESDTKELAIGPGSEAVSGWVLEAQSDFKAHPPLTLTTKHLTFIITVAADYSFNACNK